MKKNLLYIFAAAFYSKKGQVHYDRNFIYKFLVIPCQDDNKYKISLLEREFKNYIWHDFNIIYEFSVDSRYFNNMLKTFSDNKKDKKLIENIFNYLLLEYTDNSLVFETFCGYTKKF